MLRRVVRRTFAVSVEATRGVWTCDEETRAAILENALRGRQPSDLMLRCTILDAHGHVKSPRDLRKIDSRIPNLVPTILARKEAILVNILHIRALVKADAVILFDSYGSVDSRLHSVFLYHLEHNLKRTTSLPYEFRALESILLSVVSALEAEMVFSRHLIAGLLAELEDDIDRDKFKRLLHYSRRLQSFMNRAKLVQAALEEVLQQGESALIALIALTVPDEDLRAMYLSDKKLGVPRTIDDHDDLELLLESFDKQVEEIVNEAETTMTNVQSTQEIVELILDSNRNALLALDLKVSIGTLGIGVGALVAGLFGMNLQSHLENDKFAFITVSSLAMGVAGLVAFLGMRSLISPSITSTPTRPSHVADPHPALTPLSPQLDRIRRVGLSSGRPAESRSPTVAKRGWLPSSLRAHAASSNPWRWPWAKRLHS
ncbi:Mitochondrial inner membrane magnesium transporter mrs2 [Ceratobasidium theobromae]|uniref:Magnesium transporter n=1 Tax=Ceratobasidium theobromae TaxID=1582974 RepID=A0A5N5QHK5_9AGAM|nr:Mitochondrial inner membrane magnesium transporter mrs2 [Ceratobasidium theobromae]